MPPRNPKSERKPSAFNLGASNIHQVRALKQVMKTQNVALGNMLQEPRREISTNSKARQSGKSNGSDYHSKESRSAGGSVSGAGRKQKLLSTKQVDNQMIQTPMQYQMALRAQEVTNKIQRQIKKEQRKQADKLKHTRFGAQRQPEKRGNRFNSQTRPAAGKSQSSLPQAELPRRRLPSYNSGKASSKVRKAAPKRSATKASKESLQP